MRTIGHLAAIHRYPVKSMAGESLSEAALTPDGLAHDRLYAFDHPAAPPGMLRVSGNQRRELLRYSARLDPSSRVRVLTPSGQDLAIEDPTLLGPGFTLTCAATPQTDVRPLALLSLQTIAQLSAELSETLDSRRFRANLLLDLPQGAFSEDTLVGKAIALGQTAILKIRERIPRCRFITYDPVNPHLTPPNFPLMKLLDRAHANRTGIYATVLTPGSIAAGDSVSVIS